EKSPILSCQLAESSQPLFSTSPIFTEDSRLLEPVSGGMGKLEKMRSYECFRYRSPVKLSRLFKILRSTPKLACVCDSQENSGLGTRSVHPQLFTSSSHK